MRYWFLAVALVAVPSVANAIEEPDYAVLKAALRAVDLPWTGEPVYARYNPPSTPWFMRRNEIWLTVQ